MAVRISVQPKYYRIFQSNDSFNEKLKDTNQSAVATLVWKQSELGLETSASSVKRGIGTQAKLSKQTWQSVSGVHFSLKIYKSTTRETFFWEASSWKENKSNQIHGKAVWKGAGGQ